MTRIYIERTGPETTKGPTNVTVSTILGNSHTPIGNYSSEIGPTKKVNRLEVNGFHGTTQPLGHESGTASVDFGSARNSQLGQLSDRNHETLNSRKVSPRGRLSGVNGQRVLVTIGILLVILNVFMTPLNFLILFETLHTGYLSRSVKFIFMNMAIFNSALNPLINVFRVRPFKEALKQKGIKLCGLFCRRS